jgi:preprotein translocase subunit SecE
MLLDVTDERLGRGLLPKRPDTMADKIKIVVAALLVAAGLAGFYYMAEKALILRVGAVLGGLVAAGLLFLTTELGRQFKAYAQDSVDETRKVVWPTRKETLQTTAVVFAFVVIMALFLWLVDGSLLWTMKKLIGRGEA